MATQNYFILTAAQRTAAMAFNNGYNTDPRLVDTALQVSGTNLNDDAVGVSAGDQVLATGNYVAPVRIANDLSYKTENPDLVAYLSDMPFALLEDETIFLPPVPI